MSCAPRFQIKHFGLGVTVREWAAVAMVDHGGATRVPRTPRYGVPGVDLAGEVI